MIIENIWTDYLGGVERCGTNMSRLAVYLTLDQVSKIIGSLENFYYEERTDGELDRYMLNHNAFIRRLIDDLKKARATVA